MIYNDMLCIRAIPLESSGVVLAVFTLPTLLRPNHKLGVLVVHRLDGRLLVSSTFPSFRLSTHFRAGLSSYIASNAAASDSLHTP